jgi:hypothetical protein
MGPFLVFPIPAITFSFQNPSFIPAYLMTLFISMLACWHILKNYNITVLPTGDTYNHNQDMIYIYICVCYVFVKKGCVLTKNWNEYESNLSSESNTFQYWYKSGHNFHWVLLYLLNAHDKHIISSITCHI